MAGVSEQKYLESQGVHPEQITTSYDDNQHVHGSPGNGVADNIPPVATTGPKKLVEAYILCFPLGLFGAHQFYLRRYGFGVLYLCTFGLFGCGFLADMIRMPCLVKEANRKINESAVRRANPSIPKYVEPKSISDAYVLWFPMGLFGLHHFYLHRIGWGFLYLFTMGLFGVGWLIDGFRMKHLVDHVNKKRASSCQKPYKEKALCDVYILTANPLTGLLGIQHYYIGRPGFGIYYTLTFGGLGIGWLIDLFRMPLLVKDVNKRKTEGDNLHKRLDDAYVLCIPLGFLGLHHFFLNRPCWGALYLCTFGCFGIGWLVDWFRLPCLVKDYNNRLPGPIQTVSGATTTTVIVISGNNQPSQQGPYPPVPNPQAAGVQPPYPVQQYPPQQYPPQQYPQQQYPGQMVGPQPPQYYPSMDYGTAGETSWSTINSSDFGDQPPTYTNQSHDPDQPPSYAASQAGGSAQMTDPETENATNQKRAAPPVPSAPSSLTQSSLPEKK